MYKSSRVFTGRKKRADGTHVPRSQATDKSVVIQRLHTEKVQRFTSHRRKSLVLVDGSPRVAMIRCSDVAYSVQLAVDACPYCCWSIPSELCLEVHRNLKQRIVVRRTFVASKKENPSLWSLLFFLLRKKWVVTQRERRNTRSTVGI